MSNAVVYINGQKVGSWPYGYNSFYFDVSDYVQPGKNLLAVRLENEMESSRWYPGAGLYRNVRLEVTEKEHIAHWGTYVTTPEVTAQYARIHIATDLAGLEKQGVVYSLKTVIKDASGSIVTQHATAMGPYQRTHVQQELFVENPVLWEPDGPNLYQAESELYRDGKLVDTYQTTFGVRTLEIKPNDGFYLNGKRTVFNGVCLHHDLGPLGAAVNESAIRRQLRIMKDMGVNAIRTSHNMPAPELIRACDEMGIMVMAESFDEWKIPKMKNGYNKYFDEWAEKDLVNLIKHYRNNPSVVMWCIGNEVPEQGSPEGSKVARYLQDICHREDPSRPVTQGMDNPDAVINSSFASTMDVAGFNYRPFRYPEAYKKLQQQIILGTETASTVSSRAVYKFPVERKAMAKYEDHQASSYDVEHCSWSDLPEDNFMQHEDLPYTIGEFVWTGFDYLGEPTPYYTDWPSHSSLFGIVDLAGIPKDRYYLYRSHWNKASHTLHILPHWNWKGREGETTPIFVYTDYPAAEVFINGKSQGLRKKDLNVSLENSADKQAQHDFKRQQRYRLMWLDTKYEPGTVTVVAYDSLGNIVARDSVQTAGKLYTVRLEADRKELKANGKDIAFVTATLVDRAGNMVTGEDRELKFTVKGEGAFKAVANGDPASLESFQRPHMKSFGGQLVFLVESGSAIGDIVAEVEGKGLKKTSIKLTVK
jgi:beta-galactosidase